MPNLFLLQILIVMVTWMFSAHQEQMIKLPGMKTMAA